MVLRVNDPDKLYPSGTMQAARDAEKRFRAPVARPAPTKMMKSRVAPNLGPQRVASRVQAPEAPDLISYETNPEIDSKTASLINAARVKGHQTRLGNVQQAQSSLDTAFQTGQNQLGVQGLSNRGAFNRTVRTGQDALQRTLVGERGATNRLGISNTAKALEAQKAHTRELERLGVISENNLTSQQLGIAGDYFGAGGTAAGAQQLVNSPTGSMDFSGLTPPPQKTSSSSKFIKGDLTETIGGGYRYKSYPMTAGPDGKARPDYDAIPYSTLVKLPEDQQREVLIGQGLDADEVNKMLESIRQGK